MNGHVEDLFSGLDGICGNNNMSNVLQVDCAINSVSNSEELSFSECYAYCIVNRFGDNLLTSIDM